MSSMEEENVFTNPQDNEYKDKMHGEVLLSLSVRDVQNAVKLGNTGAVELKLLMAVLPYKIKESITETVKKLKLHEMELQTREQIRESHTVTPHKYNPKIRTIGNVNRLHNELFLLDQEIVLTTLSIIVDELSKAGLLYSTGAAIERGSFSLYEEMKAKGEPTGD